MNKYTKPELDFAIDRRERMIRIAEIKDLENVLSDIENGIVWLLDEDGCMIGTVTIKENAVNRLYVLPEYQSRGYGSQLMDFAEAKILEKFNHVHIDSSLPAKEIMPRKLSVQAKFLHKIGTGYRRYLQYPYR